MRNPIVNQKQYMKPVRIKNGSELASTPTSEMTLHQDIMEEEQYVMDDFQNRAVSALRDADRWRKAQLSDNLEILLIPSGYVNRAPETHIDTRNGQL